MEFPFQERVVDKLKTTAYLILIFFITLTFQNYHIYLFLLLTLFFPHENVDSTRAGLIFLNHCLLPRVKRPAWDMVIDQ